MPVGHGVRAVLAARVGHGSAVLEATDLARWGVSAEDAFEAARRNLEGEGPAGIRGFVPVETAPGKMAMGSFSGERSARMLLLPGLHGVLRDQLGADEALAAVPDEGSFLAVDAADAEGAAALRQLAGRRWREAERPLTPELFRVGEGGVAEA
jgi:hypothetical protein